MRVARHVSLRGNLPQMSTKGRPWPEAKTSQASELDPHRNLQVAGHVLLSRHLAESRIGRIGVRIRESHLVESVQRFEPELERHALANLCVLDNRGVPRIIGVTA